MNVKDFGDYLRDFETEVIQRGVSQNRLGKSGMVPVRNGKLLRKPFGRALGREIYVPEIVAVDYYGHIKKSTGFFAYAQEQSDQIEGQLKMITAPIIHFAQIRIEDVYTLSKSPDLIGRFPEFKEELLRMKGFAK